MNVERLERMIEILERPLPKKFTFAMSTFGTNSIDKMGQICQTSGCIAYIIGTDSYFTSLGYSCETGEQSNAVPRLNSGNGYYSNIRALSELFNLSDKEVTHIFFSNYYESTTKDAVDRIKSVLNGERG